MQSRIPAGAGADPLELEAALQQLKVEHKEQSRASVDAAGNCTERTPTVAKVWIYSRLICNVLTITGAKGRGNR